MSQTELLGKRSIKESFDIDGANLFKLACFKAYRQKRHPQKAAGNRLRRRIFPDRAAFVAGT